jgi:hypothetical protein
MLIKLKSVSKDDKHVVMVPKNTTKGKMVKSKAMIQFLPGYNEIDEKDWNAIKNNCKRKLDSGDMEILKVENKAVSFLEIAKEDPEGAREVIQATYRVETLERWRKETPRDELRAVIMNQIDTIQNHGKKKE